MAKKIPKQIINLMEKMGKSHNLKFFHSQGAYAWIKSKSDLIQIDIGNDYSNDDFLKISMNLACPGIMKYPEARDYNNELNLMISLCSELEFSMHKLELIKETK